MDSNHRPHGYQPCALTGLSYRPSLHFGYTEKVHALAPFVLDVIHVIARHRRRAPTSRICLATSERVSGIRVLVLAMSPSPLSPLCGRTYVSPTAKKAACLGERCIPRFSLTLVDGVVCCLFPRAHSGNYTSPSGGLHHDDFFAEHAYCPLHIYAAYVDDDAFPTQFLVLLVGEVETLSAGGIGAFTDVAMRTRLSNHRS